MTGNQDRTNAVKAVGLGAYDFHQKPFDPEVLGLVVERAFRLHALQQENRRMQQSQPIRRWHGIVTRDPGMFKMCRSIERVAPGMATVMLLGESGTGKEVLAKARAPVESALGQERSSRSTARRFLKTCWNRELFGYEKGRIYRAPASRTRGKIELRRRRHVLSRRGRAICRSRCRPSCCAFCRSEWSSA